MANGPGGPLRAIGSNPSYWISIDEDEFAEQLRTHGWGERAIEEELGTLRVYKAQFRYDRQPTPTVAEVAEQVEAEVARGEHHGSMASHLFNVQRNKDGKRKTHAEKQSP